MKAVLLNGYGSVDQLAYEEIPIPLASWMSRTRACTASSEVSLAMFRIEIHVGKTEILTDGIRLTLAERTGRPGLVAPGGTVPVAEKADAARLAVSIRPPAGATQETPSAPAFAFI